MCSIGKKRFSVGLVAQLFQPASNWVETVEKALVVAAIVFAGSKHCYLRVTCVISSICTARVMPLVNKNKAGNPSSSSSDSFFTTSSSKNSERTKEATAQAR